MLKSLAFKITLAHLITIILWASAFPGIKAALTAYSPEQVSLLRLLIGSITLIFVAFSLGIRLPEIKDIPMILLLGFLGFSVYQIALNYGEQTVSAGIASLLVSTTPLFTAILALLFFREVIGLWGWIGSIIAFSGVAFISLDGSAGNISFSSGVILVLIASLSESIYFVFQNAYLKKYGIITFTIYTIWAGTFFMLIFVPGLGETIIHAPIDTTLVVLYLGVFPTVIPYFTLAYITSKTGASEATSSLYLTTVFAFLIAWIWLGEVPRFSAIVGSVITLFGVFIANIKKENTIKENISA